MAKIITEDNAVLHEVATEVRQEEIRSKQVHKIISSMKEALASEPYGVAIAAPQIGESLRIFVVAGKVFNAPEGANREETKAAEEDKKTMKCSDQTFINPKIIKKSKNKKEFGEGCLSVPHLYGTVARYEKATISYLDESGNKQIRGASGFLAQIFQHEIDHLNGILYTDKASEIHKVDKDFNKID